MLPCRKARHGMFNSFTIRRAGLASNRLASVLRLLRDAFYASALGLVGETTPALRSVEAVEAGASTLCRATPSGRGERPRRSYGGQPSRPLAEQPQTSPELCLFDSRLRLAWPTSTLSSASCSTSLNRRVRTRTHGGVTGKAREGLPMSILCPAP